MKKIVFTLTILCAFGASSSSLHAADPMQGQINMVQYQLARVQRKIQLLQHESSAESGKKAGLEVREVNPEAAQALHDSAAQEMERLLQLEQALQERLDTLRAQQ